VLIGIVFEVLQFPVIFLPCVVGYNMSLERSQ